MPGLYNSQLMSFDDDVLFVGTRSRNDVNTGGMM
jgi:hypothetical protein